MRIEYSKPAADLQKEGAERLLNDHKQKLFQENQLKRLATAQDRTECVLCGNGLSGELFLHRETPTIFCRVCGHLQTKKLPPPDFPDMEFATIYPSLSAEEYHDRKRRIYQPKLDWIIRSLAPLRYSAEKLAEMRWTEMGAGAGYFTSALKDKGFHKVKGFDADRKLVELANNFAEGTPLSHYEGKMADAIAQYPAEIYTSFFVLEHLPDAFHFFQELNKLPPGTLFIFAVPVFGLACLLENIFSNNFARSFDCVVHTQVYTDKSIQYALENSGFSILSEWVFGQDSSDLTRFMITNLQDKLSPAMIESLAGNLTSIEDGIQNCVDKAMLADQRHVIAIKD
nr:class I SAM-dependent methyltransferase [Desulfobulbaceae bacterium]